MLTLAERCRAIRYLLLDVDGVLSDGGIAYDDHAVESKTFHVRDGFAIKRWQKVGLGLGVLSARPAQATLTRAAELGIATVVQSSPDKRVGWARFLEEWQAEPRQVAFIADDLPDVPVLSVCGLAIAVADACPEVVRVAHYVTRVRGGRGAVREGIELILRCQGSWV
jgi:YrbI family 3-deoxy-D-manno-octulosonate 8-phosphate phosphatase